MATRESGKLAYAQIYQVAGALDYLHSLNITHGDVVERTPESSGVDRRVDEADRGLSLCDTRVIDERDDGRGCRRRGGRPEDERELSPPVTMPTFSQAGFTVHCETLTKHYPSNTYLLLSRNHRSPS